jgi:hypothetical protein
VFVIAGALVATQAVTGMIDVEFKESDRFCKMTSTS